MGRGAKRVTHPGGGLSAKGRGIGLNESGTLLARRCYDDHLEGGGGVRGKTKRRIGYAAAGVVILGILSGCTGILSGERWLKREVARRERDAEGVILGAEDRTLGDPAAPVACLLVHGFGGTGNNFNELPEALAEAGYYVRVPRLPGHGTTPDDMAERTEAELLDAVRVELDALRESHQQVYLVGFSMGGTLATIVASEKDVDGLVLIAPYYEVRMHWYYGIKPHRWNHLLSPVVEYVPRFECFTRCRKKEVWPDIIAYNALPTRFVHVLEALGEQAYNPETLGKITAPVILLQSTSDFTASPDASKQAVETMKSERKEMVWYQNSDHILLWDYDGADATARIVRFVQEQTHTDAGIGT